MSILAAIEDQEGIIRPPRFNNKVSSTRPEQGVTLKDFVCFIQSTESTGRDVEEAS
jgi:hypothetical protein